ncbi:MAG: hypothetical protein ABTQ30_10500 [Rhizobiaceae bacterium]
MPAGCAAPTGGGTDHSGSIAASEAWTAAASPHRIATDVTVSAAATLTLEACTIVELAPGASLRVDGKLVARGALGRPVVLLARDAQSPWRALDVRGGELDLEYTRVADGGLPEAGGGHVALFDPRDAAALETAVRRALSGEFAAHPPAWEKLRRWEDVARDLAALL